MAQTEQPNPTSSQKDDATDWNTQIEYVKELAQIVAQEGVSLLEIEADGVKITLKGAAPPLLAAPENALIAPQIQPQAVMMSQNAAAPHLFSAPTAPASAASLPTAPTASAAEKFTPVESPMVGVFYRAPSPSDPNFVEIGDTVSKGQTIGLVEAMKVFNEIVAESSGTVAQIAAESGALVETGQPLLFLK